MAAARCRCTCAWIQNAAIAALRQGMFVQGLLSTGQTPGAGSGAGCRAHRQAPPLCAGRSEWSHSTSARHPGHARRGAGADAGGHWTACTGTAVVAGRLGPLRGEGTSRGCTDCTTAAPAPASVSLWHSAISRQAPGHVVYPSQSAQPGVGHHGDAGLRGAGPVFATSGWQVDQFPEHRLSRWWW